jgi:branched-subunit amino acid transport protein
VSEPQIYLLVLAAGFGTYLIRLSFLLILGNREVSPVIRQALEYIPPAAFAALTLPAVLSPAGVVDLSLENLRLVAAVAAMLVGLWTRSITWVLASGLIALWALKYLFGH